MRLRYSTLRFIAALSAGGCAMVLAICIMWTFTQLPVQDVIFVSLFAYLAVGGLIGLLTEPKKAAKPVKRPRQFCMYNMTRRCWDVRAK